MTKTVIKGFRFRIYPDMKQEETIRYVLKIYHNTYNRALAIVRRNFEEKKPLPDKESLKCSVLPYQTKDRGNIPKAILYHIVSEAIFQLYFNIAKLKKDGRLPNFKSMDRKLTVPLFVNQVGFRIDFESKNIELLQTGTIKAKGLYGNQPPNRRIYLQCLTQNRYYISYSAETQHEIMPSPLKKKRIGLDLGLNNLVTSSDGEVILNRRFLKRMAARVHALQRELQRKTKGSKNYYRTRAKLQNAYLKIANKRKDFLGKISYRLVKHNTFISMESLDIKDMEKKRLISKSLQDTSLGELVRYLQYKSLWNDRTLVFVPKYYPSSQLCSNCGYRNPDLKDLSIREWTCPKCHTHHDRDINAAKNILRQGLSMAISKLKQEKERS